ncbi:MAG: restriction endonuclease [archaeon]|nr:restriction endonuclease [archaeon]
MDVNTLLDFSDELLSMYGYVTRRSVGVRGGKILTSELAKETGREGEVIPAKEEAGVLYKVDILAEKKDIERPFGRVVVRYTRGTDPADAGDVNHINAVMKAAQGYSAILLSTTGFTEAAKKAADSLGTVTLMGPKKLQQLLGKAMVKEQWWHNAPAFPVLWDYEKVRWKLKWFFEKMLFINFNTIWFMTKMLVYEPYWKFSYSVSSHGHMKEGTFAINAVTGELDLWRDIDPELWAEIKGSKKEAIFDNEIIYQIESLHMAPRTKIKKPKLPAGVHFEVLRPVMEKHEAKLAAMQWVSYVEDVKPEDVVITSRELIYAPWLNLLYFYIPILKNAWEDTEFYGIKMTAVFGDIFNQWKNYHFKRDIIYYYMEKSLLRLLGRDRYVSFMRKVTYGIASMWWNYELVIKPGYIWGMLMLVTAGTMYAFITASWGLGVVLGLLMIMIFLGPGYAFLYLIQDYLRKYPDPAYPHPKMTKKRYDRILKPIHDAKDAMRSLEILDEEGKLTKREKKLLHKVRGKKVRGLYKKAKRHRKKL